MIAMWLWVLARFTSPEVLALTLSVTIEVVRQLKLSGAVEEQT
jgi:hypothetical protein